MLETMELGLIVGYVHEGPRSVKGGKEDGIWMMRRVCDMELSRNDGFIWSLLDCTVGE